jgi:anti-sigma B factor antagonist
VPITDGDDLRGSNSVQTHGEWTVVVPPAEVDPSTAPDLRAAIDELRTNGVRCVAVDWRPVTFFDSSAIGVLMGAHREVTESGGRLAVICATGVPRRLFDLMGLDQVLTFVTTIDELD